MKNACRRRSFCYLPVVFDRNLAYGNDFFLCGEKMFDLFLRILPRLLINFFGISRNFLFFCVLRELLENVIKKEARGVPSILRSFYVQRGWKRLEKSIKETVGRRLTFDVRRIGLFVLLALLHHSSFLSSHLGSTLLFPCFLARKLTSFAICRMFLLS
jgi:hypothetical protein